MKKGRSVAGAPFVAMRSTIGLVGLLFLLDLEALAERGVVEHHVDLLGAGLRRNLALAVVAAEADLDAVDFQRGFRVDLLAVQNAADLLELSGLDQLMVGLGGELGSVTLEGRRAIVAAEVNLAAIELDGGVIRRAES